METFYGDLVFKKIVFVGFIVHLLGDGMLYWILNLELCVIFLVVDYNDVSCVMFFSGQSTWYPL